MEEARSKAVIEEQICDEGRCKEKFTLGCQTKSCGTNPQCPKGYDRILDSEKFTCLTTRPKNYAADPKTCLAMTNIATIILNAMIWNSLRLKMFALDHLLKKLVVTKFNIEVSE
jgi:hypothetical protein